MVKIIYTTITIILVIASYVFGVSNNKQKEAAIATADKDLFLINPSVIAGLKKHYIINVLPLKQKFLEIKKNYPNDTFVYFAYLNNDSWVGIQEKEYFKAASTIKVPLSMSVMKNIELGKIKMNTPYTITEEDLDDRFGELYKEGQGKTYTVEELLKFTLEKSDNTSMKALIRLLKDVGVGDPFSEVYSFMGWEKIPEIGVAPTYIDINLKTLSNMFLALYNGQYISPENSNVILKFLDNSNFNDGIVSGIPSNIAVAHKTGVQEQENTFSDCGIIYVPQRNYLLCVGSKGVKQDTSNKFMKEISKAAYEYVINN